MAFISPDTQHEEQHLQSRIIDRKLTIHGTKIDLVLMELQETNRLLSILASTKPKAIDLKATVVDTLWFRLGILATLWALGINLKDALAFLKF
jgi:hypothetical protein